jgi:predicted esterase
VEDNVWLYLAISDWVEKTRRQGRRQADSDLEEMNMHGRRLVCIIGPLAVTLCAVMVDERTLAGQSTAAPAREAVTTDVVYGHKAGMALTFDIYRPAMPNGSAVISVLSGGWRSTWETLQQFREAPTGGLRLLTEKEILEQGGILPSHSYRTLLDKGFTVFAVRHGSSPTFGMVDIVADMRRAVRFIRSQSAAYGINADRIGIWGGSAGGHLALLLGTTKEIANPDAKEDFERGPAPLAAVVAYAPPTDFVALAAYWKRDIEKYPAVRMAEREQRAYSPITYVSPDDAPALIIHGDRDTTVPIVQGQSMYDALVKAGVDSRLVTMERSGARLPRR